MKAILSCIHGNLEALEAVLEDAIRHGADGIFSLGDVAGYGPDPRECLDLVLAWEIALLGNFDLAVLNDRPDWGSISAVDSLMYAQAQILAPVPNEQAAERRRAFLERLPRTARAGPFLFVHGSPRDPDEYVFPEDIYSQKKLAGIFAQVERYCLMGHTHIPGIFTQDMQFFNPAEIDDTYRLDDRKTLVNVGSVGQPRDGDWRPCYVLLDGDTIRFRRIEYDVDTTVQKIRQAKGLDEYLAHRLREGR